MLSIKTIESIGSKFMASDKDVSFVSFPIDFVTLVYYGQGLSRCTDMIRTHDNSHPIMLFYLIKEKEAKGKLFLFLYSAHCRRRRAILTSVIPLLCTRLL